MGIELLVVAVAKAPYLRGEPVAWKEQPCEWGAKETLPNWVRLIISDATIQQVQNFLAPLRSVFTYTVVASTAEGYRIRVEINPAIVTIFGADAGMRADLYEWLQENYNAQNVPHLANPPYSYTLDFPDPNLDSQKLREEFEDIAQQTLAPHRYHFSDTDVNTAIANGGVMAVTAAVAANRIIDRLA